jgi:hypothetical protein
VQRKLSYKVQQIKDITTRHRMSAHLKLNAAGRWSSSVGQLLRASDAVVPGDPAVRLPDLMADFGLIEWAGVGLGAAEVFRLLLSIKTLAAALPKEVMALRFFGRITTRGLPYWVVEGTNVNDDVAAAEKKEREGIEGANRKCYWVTQSLQTSWTLLPPVTCSRVVISRRFKYALTGDLDATPNTYPTFLGSEADLLRTLIARIAAATHISPIGVLELREEDADGEALPFPEVVPVAEDEERVVGDLKEASAWVYVEREFNGIGRVTPPANRR